MTLFTAVWNLLKKNPATDANDTFNIQTMLNDNWDKLDSALGLKAINADVRAATIGNIGLSGLQTIDGVTLRAGDRVLVKDQTTGSDNGIYIATTDTWSRAPDADTSAKLAAGLFAHVKEGNTYVGTGWILATTGTGTVTLGSTSLTFVQKTGAGAATDAVIGSRTIDDSIVADSGADTPTRLWSKLANMIKAITGKSNWYTAPVTSIESLNAGKLNASAYTAADVLAKIKTVDGDGSGLDADMVDGIHVVDLARKAIYVPPNTDLNSLTAEGEYYNPLNVDASTMPNVPLPVSFNLKVSRSSGCNQTFISYNPDALRIFSRSYYNGGWGAWRELWTSGNLLNPAKLDSENVFTGNQTFNGNVYVNNHGFGGSPFIALAIGDSDTGLHSTSDGSLQIYTNSSPRATIDGQTFNIITTNLQHNGNAVFDTGNSPASFGTNGYQKLASGMIMQWGSVTAYQNSAPTDVSFPIPFPTACLSVQASVESNSPKPLGVGNYSTTGCRVFQSDTVARPVHWFAIGY
ncbi:pyocin knob domain-containing protein [Cohnella zeiphila]|uniref:Putative tail fiber protein gp53-like C-terminal domain-containing protein n=1 Tax=Cohnella zeiphila TaxID=2761120 RepID=A0A7X0SJX1_9BACL|nr:hypothetical protein [Cohnella zeiphila]MBB6730065.1 hypothetical protein [Cohnella zeiphila]